MENKEDQIKLSLSSMYPYKASLLKRAFDEAKSNFESELAKAKSSVNFGLFSDVQDMRGYFPQYIETHLLLKWETEKKEIERKMRDLQLEQARDILSQARDAYGDDQIKIAIDNGRPILVSASGISDPERFAKEAQKEMGDLCAHLYSDFSLKGAIKKLIGLSNNSEQEQQMIDFLNDMDPSETCIDIDGNDSFRLSESAR